MAPHTCFSFLDMKELLPFFTHPSHYIGIELNSVHKSKDIPLKWCLAFPDKYPVGVSYFGHQILYGILNKRKEIWAQRVYAPSTDVGRILKQKKVPLATLEGDIPLLEMDVVGFSITHEMCYTTVLYMLDLAQIPFCSNDRDKRYPLIIAGGEGVLNPAPLERFIDAFVFGDGEEIVLEISDILLKYKFYNKEKLLSSISEINGVYVPSLGKKKVKRRICMELKREDVPISQVVPFGKPVHDRYVVEIAKGCSRGCRFCFAGMVNRPVRERDVNSVKSILENGLDRTGYEDIGFLSLSVGDFSKLDVLISTVFSKCIEENISLSLPSLRAGSIPEELIHYLGMLKKRGLTLAPEAGTQRLRNVINKGISEEDILNHARWAFENGWQQIKLYFMIGLPTETKEDLEGILNLCLKIWNSIPGKKRRFKISASISPFVPKPHTPFQWERQNSLEEIKEKIHYLNGLFKKYRFLNLSWPILEMSLVEGVFSRGDERLSHAILDAYQAGDVFTSWKEHFDYSLWSSVFQKLDVSISKYLGDRDIEGPLPWDFVDIGVSKEFLKKELNKALEEKNTPDCRWGKCSGCGVCDFKEIYPLLNSNDKSCDNLKETLIFYQNELSAMGLRLLEPPKIKNNKNKLIENQKEALINQSFLKVGITDLEEERNKYFYLFWFEKTKLASYLSQLELQKVIERTIRRVKLPIVFSKGFTPRPKISFGRALPVGVWSLCEYMVVQTTKTLDLNVLEMLNKRLIEGIRFTSFTLVEDYSNMVLSKRELYEIVLLKKRDISTGIDSICVFKKDKKISLREIIVNWEKKGNSLWVMFDWSTTYVNPLSIARAILPGVSEDEFRLVKHRQFFD